MRNTSKGDARRSDMIARLPRSRYDQFESNNDALLLRNEDGCDDVEEFLVVDG